MVDHDHWPWDSTFQIAIAAYDCEAIASRSSWSSWAQACGLNLSEVEPLERLLPQQLNTRTRISVLSEKLLKMARKLPHRNLAVELRKNLRSQAEILARVAADSEARPTVSATATPP
jgi:hypothetical protein